MSIYSYKRKITTEGVDITTRERERETFNEDLRMNKKEVAANLILLRIAYMEILINVY